MVCVTIESGDNSLLLLQLLYLGKASRKDITCLAANSSVTTEFQKLGL